MTDAELAALEARMITIPAALALENADKPQANGDTDAAQDGDGCADDEAAGNMAAIQSGGIGIDKTRQHIHEAAGGIEPPPWWRSDLGAHAGIKSPDHAGKLADRPLTTPQIARAVYRTTQSWHVGNVRRAAPRVAERVRKVRSHGYPVLWRLK